MESWEGSRAAVIERVATSWTVLQCNNMMSSIITEDLILGLGTTEL